MADKTYEPTPAEGVGGEAAAAVRDRAHREAEADYQQTDNPPVPIRDEEMRPDIDEDPLDRWAHEHGHTYEGDKTVNPETDIHDPSGVPHRPDNPLVPEVDEPVNEPETFPEAEPVNEPVKVSEP